MAHTAVSEVVQSCRTAPLLQPMIDTMTLCWLMDHTKSGYTGKDSAFAELLDRSPAI
ncbi:MAG: hypothetical protein ACK5WH_13050 [Hyphomonadaceae bacterium]